MLVAYPILCLTLPPPLLADTLKVQQAEQSTLQAELTAGLEERAPTVDSPVVFEHSKHRREGLGVLGQLGKREIEVVQRSSSALEEAVAILARLAGVPLGDVSDEAHEVRSLSEML